MEERGRGSSSRLTSTPRGDWSDPASKRTRSPVTIRKCPSG